MAIKPGGSPIFIGAYELYLDDVKVDFRSEFFDRLEFDHEKLRQAKEQSGAKPTFVPSFAGNQTQVQYTCTPVSPRPVTPNDSDINNIEKRWDIITWTLTGSPTPGPTIQGLFNNVYMPHKKLMDIYNYHQKTCSSVDISYELLVQFQQDTLLFLANTGVFMIGNVLNGNVGQVLMTSFIPGVEYENTATPGQIYYSWTATVEQRSLRNANDNP